MYLLREKDKIHYPLKIYVGDLLLICKDSSRIGIDKESTDLNYLYKKLRRMYIDEKY